MADWSQRDDDLDANASFVIYAGKACEEVKTRMQHGPLEVVEDLRHMPEAAFEFYLKCFLEALIADDYPHDMRGVAMFAACQLLHEKARPVMTQRSALPWNFFLSSSRSRTRWNCLQMKSRHSVLSSMPLREWTRHALRRCACVQAVTQRPSLVRNHPRGKPAAFVMRQ